ncbi:VOC family protein [Halobacillus sp. Marseille-Q1614]|uniref:VOC family protein n=1 Tax=Halobacillus sp. Marseille-Q1614 TaxID=2709134 RepID=UPI00156F1E45|nr:VOC family protein [Halobacillus sp. Marseille-Q1614]
MIDRIDTLCLIVKDVEKSCRWYQEILGFEVAFRGEGYRVLSVGSNSIPLTLEEGDRHLNTHQTYPIFFSKNIKKTYEELKGKSVSVSELCNDDVNNFFNFYDLDGNKLQVCFFE